jgi:hypothetical protein
MLTTTFGSFASLTVGCARCHDHKFDPITQQEYYGLQAVFSGANRTDRPRDARLQYNPLHRWWLLPARFQGPGEGEGAFSADGLTGNTTATSMPT